jgi:Holliday junction resolvase-like predicted endonuclease
MPSIESTTAEKTVPLSTPAMSSWHVGVAAEAIAAAQFARCGYDVSVQYGANQPEYDLIVARGDAILKVSVKGSQDGGWGLTQGHKKGASYHEAADAWAQRHKARTVICFVQFAGVALDQLPRLYLATASEVAAHLKRQAVGRGDTILFEKHAWRAHAAGAGTVDEIPDAWRFTAGRVADLLLPT